MKCPGFKSFVPFSFHILCEPFFRISLDKWMRVRIVAGSNSQHSISIINREMFNWFFGPSIVRPLAKVNRIFPFSMDHLQCNEEKRRSTLKSTIYFKTAVPLKNQILIVKKLWNKVLITIYNVIYKMIQTYCIISHENNIFFAQCKCTPKQKPTNKSRETNDPCIAQNPKK